MEDQDRQDSASNERPGTVIGRYTLLRKLGEGGFGSVFMAEQREPVRRQVALKIIKLGMDTRDVIARFEQERQALALMDHPHVAKVLDAGATDSGRPYFVMELVEGVPITEYCDEHRLTVSERLEVMFDVCQAVQHAHGKGLIHRDLKPGNVLVATRDGRPHPKVIDFGVAKATAKLTERTLLTEEFQMIGTPLYMSPEQAAGSLDIDTRTDVYSLGVLLYEVLTSATPVDEETLRTAMYHEVQRLIREVEPPKPSTRIVSGRAPISELAAARRTEPARLASVLRGDLDWIVMKALEKDAARRYGTASELAQDIRRHLSGEPVVAAPPSRSYRFTKFVRRNRGAVAAAAAVFLAIVAGLVGMLWQAHAAETQRDLAVTAKADAEKIADFQSSALRSVDPSAMGRELVADLRSRVGEARTRAGASETDRDAALASFDALLAGVNATDAARRIIDANILDPASKAVTERFGAQPAIEGPLRGALRQTYSSLGMADKALPEAQRELEVLVATRGSADRQTLFARQALGMVYLDLGKFSECDAALSAAESEYSARFPADDPDALLIRLRLGVLDMSQSRNVEAKKTFESVAAAQERSKGPDSPEVGDAILKLGVACLNLRETEGAIPHFERAARIFSRTKGETDATTLEARQRLAKAYQAVGRREEAVAMQLETIATLERTKGERHPSTAGALTGLAEIYMLQVRHDDAEREARRALEIRRALRGDAHPETIKALQMLATIQSRRGRNDLAEPLFAEVLKQSEIAYGPDAPDTMKAVSNLAVEYWFLNRMEDARASFERVIEYREGLGAEGVVPAAETRISLAMCYAKLDREEDALALLDRSVADFSAKLGPENRLTLHGRSTRAAILVRTGDFEKAVADLPDVVAALRKILSPEDRSLLESIHTLANAYHQLGRHLESEPLIREAVDTRRRTIGSNHPQMLESLHLLASVLTATGRTPETRPLYEELLTAHRADAMRPNATPTSRRLYAKLLVTNPFEDLRDVGEAVRLATAAAEAAGDTDAEVLDTLALVLAAADRRDEAAAAQRRALAILPANAPKRGEYEKRFAEYSGSGEPSPPR